MSRLILFSRYIEGNQTAYIKNTIDYIATREGVEYVDSEGVRNLFNQDEALQSKDKLEKELDIYNSHKHIDYLAYRPGAEKIGDHGLFNAFGQCDLEREKDMSEAVLNEGGVIWNNILSLKREDAIDNWYDERHRWEQLLKRNMWKVARQFNIDLKNFKWIAAFHNESHHPHIHLQFYSVNPKEGRLSKEKTKQALEKIRSIFTNDIFFEEVKEYKEEKTLHRNVLYDYLRNDFNVDTLKENLSNKEKASIASECFGKNVEISEKLSSLLDNTLKVLPLEGRKSYAFMPREVKEKINEIFHLIVSNDEKVHNHFNQFINNHRELIKMYNDTDKANECFKEFVLNMFEPKKETYKGFHNAILKNLYEVKYEEYLRRQAIANMKYDISCGFSLLAKVFRSEMSEKNEQDFLRMNVSKKLKKKKHINR